MKKLLTTLFLALLLTGCTVAKSDLDILTLFSSKPTSNNSLWVGTFQLVFNDMKDNIIKRKIEFVGEKVTPELKGLNSAEFNKDMLNEESYYTSYGKTNLKAKKKIEADLKAKFNEKSDILDIFDWSEGIGKYYAYAMLKKEFQFLYDFDKLEKAAFNGSDESYNYFGIQTYSNPELKKNVEVLSYKNENDYAVKLLTKNNDIVYLYRTESNADFKTIYDKMLKETKKYKGEKSLKDDETLMVPNLKLKEKRSYKELCNKVIKGTNLYFSQALETIELELNNKGGKVKSEAAIMTKMTAMRPDELEPKRHFNYDKTFVMFLVDSGKTDPYLAIRIKDLKGIQ